MRGERILSAKEILDSAMEERRRVDVSVVVVVHNQPLSLALILRSLFVQDFSGTFEVIITDDGSNINVVNCVQESFADAKVPLRYIWQPHRGGRPAAARNNGIRLARGDYLIFLDGDMVPTQDLVRQHLELHTKEERLLVAGSRAWRGTLTEEAYQEISNFPIEVILEKLALGWNTDEVSKRREEKERKRRQQWLNSSHPWRACFSGNLSVIKAPEVFFDEGYVGWGNEDWELARRLCLQHGYKPVYEDRIVAYHLESHVSNVFRSADPEEIALHLRNIVRFADMCPELEIEEVFFGLIKLELDEETDQWRVIPRPSTYTREELEAKLDLARRWLRKKGIYP